MTPPPLEGRGGSGSSVLTAPDSAGYPSFPFRLNTAASTASTSRLSDASTATCMMLPTTSVVRDAALDRDALRGGFVGEPQEVGS